MQLVTSLAALFLAVVPVFADAGEGLSICAPEKVERMNAVEIAPGKREALRAYRGTEVLGYNGSAFNTSVTAYIYTKEPQPDALLEFLASADEVLSVHIGAESPMRGSIELKVAGEPVSGQLALFLWSEGETDYGSFLWLGEVAGRYLKLRTTYVRPEDDSKTAGAMKSALNSMRRVADGMCKPASQSSNVSSKPTPLRGAA